MLPTAPAVVPATPADAAFFWNAVLLDALLADSKKPQPQREQDGVTRASRAAAIVHAAIHDAVNGVARHYVPYLVQDRAPAGASPDAAAAAAAHATLIGLYSSQRVTFDANLTQFLGTLPPGSSRDRGAQFGTEVGNVFLLVRQNDGRNQPDPPYLEKPTPGEWRRDPIAPVADQIPPLTPGWGSVRPFALTYGPQLRPIPYPLLTSGAYANAFQEVSDKGRDTSPPGTRTADETQIALFWSYDDDLGYPIRHYNQNVRDILTQMPRPAAPTSLHTHARILALVNLAMADAGIACWDAKYAYNLWRPVEGIRRANDDNNPNTAPIPNWRPLGRPQGPVPHTTPPFPSYTSGHSSFGTAMFAILRKVYGTNNVVFTLASDELPGVQRNYNSFQGAIDENGQSRIFSGVHWQPDNSRGKTLGQQVADHIWPNFLRPIT